MCVPMTCHGYCSTCVISEANCVTCANCLHFKAGGTGPGKCSPRCPEYCTECLGDNECTTCVDGRVWVALNHYCETCDPSCLTCQGTKTNCRVCNTSYHMSHHTGLPDTCDQVVPAHCDSYTASDYCDVCTSPWTSDENGGCV